MEKERSRALLDHGTSGAPPGRRASSDTRIESVWIVSFASRFPGQTENLEPNSAGFRSPHEQVQLNASDAVISNGLTTFARPRKPGSYALEPCVLRPQ
ncbi:MAG: hypothetical protein ACRD21_04810 [Vicinamibacteria bacterium]